MFSKKCPPGGFLLWNQLRASPRICQFIRKSTLFPCYPGLAGKSSYLINVGGEFSFLQAEQNQPRGCLITKMAQTVCTAGLIPRHNFVSHPLFVPDNSLFRAAIIKKSLFLLLAHHHHRAQCGNRTKEDLIDDFFVMDARR